MGAGDAAPAGGRPAGLDRLDLRVERLRATVRFTWAFHAREIRFEVDDGSGFRRSFPETFSFHIARHDPAELYLQLEDLWSRPALLSTKATRRDAEDVIGRLLLALPRHLERVIDRLERAGTDAVVGARVYEDLLLLSRILGRFLTDRRLLDARPFVDASHHLRKLAHHALHRLVALRVRPESIDAYRTGAFEVDDPTVDPSDTALLTVLTEGDPTTVDRTLLRLGESAFGRWLEEICLDESVDVFEREDSPFGSREDEVRRAISVGTPRERFDYGRELSIFLRRPRDRDCLRMLDRLERFFLRQYDVHNAAAVIHHADAVAAGRDDADRVLSRHSPRNYAVLLGIAALPLLAGVFAYGRAPLVFDVVFSLQAVAVLVSTFWFLLVRFAWQRNLSVFRALVPRLGAGIVVGYLPVFLIDEVWDLALRAPGPAALSSVLFALSTLLFLYVEVHRRIPDPDVAFARTRSIYLLAVTQAFFTGFAATTILGPFMAARAASELVGATVSFAAVRPSMPLFVGELPRVVGVEPICVFPTVVLLMTFLSIFIGTFLQLLWEDLPITEPL